MIARDIPACVLDDFIDGQGAVRARRNGCVPSGAGSFLQRLGFHPANNASSL
ncbi:MAG: hypothetical protein MZV64_00240 [Ignavibacteriales bacterium]|nr:hypothetical protein [Ignavibacteriales bacterium]